MSKAALENVCKILFVGDQHLADNAPASRCDDYKEAIFKKLEFIFSYAITKGVANVVLLGDLFHRKRPSLNSHALVVRIMKLLLKFKHDFAQKWGREPRVFTLVGNHDIHFTITKLERQPIVVLAEAGALEILDRPYELECGVELNGHPYSEATEEDPAAYSLDFLEEESFKVWCFHSTLLPDGESFFGSWVNFNQLADIKANVVACGHYHPGYPTQEAHGKVWLNPGSISRGTAEEHNLSRELRVVGMVRYSDGRVGFKDIPVPHASAEDVFNVEDIKQVKRDRDDIGGFVEAIHTSVVEHSDVTTVQGIKSALARMSDDVQVVSRATRYIEQAADEQGA
jgi:DNA repair exonuclease SbcCD nuclease subunit